MSSSQDQQTIALAGIFQAASLVDQIAKRGMIPQHSFEASINSIFITSPSCTEEIYGGAEELPFNLQTGLKMAQDLASKGGNFNKDMTRYAMGLLHLESRLNKHPKMLSQIGQRLDQISQQAQFYNSQDNAGEALAADEHPNYARSSVITSTSALYQETLSTFSFRIQVTGEPNLLKNQDNADKIRALLLAGVRAAMLWRQVGGRRWQLLFFRSRVGRSASKILQSARSH
ncbi:MAG: high frequency lysogenization protein HflD [Motiliproteus sp.]